MTFRARTGRSCETQVWSSLSFFCPLLFTVSRVSRRIGRYLGLTDSGCLLSSPERAIALIKDGKAGYLVTAELLEPSVNLSPIALARHGRCKKGYRRTCRRCHCYAVKAISLNPGFIHILTLRLSRTPALSGAATLAWVNGDLEAGPCWALGRIDGRWRERRRRGCSSASPPRAPAALRFRELGNPICAGVLVSGVGLCAWVETPKCDRLSKVSIRESAKPGRKHGVGGREVPLCKALLFAWFVT